MLRIVLSRRHNQAGWHRAKALQIEDEELFDPSTSLQSQRGNPVEPVWKETHRKQCRFHKNLAAYLAVIEERPLQGKIAVLV